MHFCAALSLMDQSHRCEGSSLPKRANDSHTSTDITFLLWEVKETAIEAIHSGEHNCGLLCHCYVIILTCSTMCVLYRQSCRENNQLLVGGGVKKRKSDSWLGIMWLKKWRERKKRTQVLPQSVEQAGPAANSMADMLHQISHSAPTQNNFWS